MKDFFYFFSIWIKYNNRFGEITGFWGQKKIMFFHQNNPEDEKILGGEGGRDKKFGFFFPRIKC